MTTSLVGRLAVHEYGDQSGPVLVVLHGITDSGECWADLVDRLGSTYRIVAPDALGHGSSERFTADELASDHPPEAMYEAAAAVLREVGPALVLGHSMGGRTAAALAAREPTLVRAVVLEDPAWFDTSPWESSDEEATRQRVADTMAAAADTAAAVTDLSRGAPGVAGVRARGVGALEGRGRPRLRAHGSARHLHALARGRRRHRRTGPGDDRRRRGDHRPVRRARRSLASRRGSR